MGAGNGGENAVVHGLGFKFREAFHTAVRALNANAPLFEISCQTGEGLAAWVEWLRARRAKA